MAGSAADVNTLLAGLTYTPTAEYEGSDTLQRDGDLERRRQHLRDAGHGLDRDHGEPGCGAPAASTPATLTLNENATGVAIPGVSVGPLAEDSDDTVSAMLTVSHGTLHVASLSGVTVSGDGSGDADGVRAALPT